MFLEEIKEELLYCATKKELANIINKYYLYDENIELKETFMGIEPKHSIPISFVNKYINLDNNVKQAIKIYEQIDKKSYDNKKQQEIFNWLLNVEHQKVHTKTYKNNEILEFNIKHYNANNNQKYMEEYINFINNIDPNNFKINVMLKINDKAPINLLINNELVQEGIEKGIEYEL